MSRPTPEADAKWAASWSEGGCDEDSLLLVMQSLERERDEARELARELRDAVQAFIDADDECEREFKQMGMPPPEPDS
jgi:hypothetical protein